MQDDGPARDVELRVMDGDDRAAMHAQGGHDDDTVALLEEPAVVAEDRVAASSSGDGGGGEDDAGGAADNGGGVCGGAAVEAADDEEDRQVAMEDVVHSLQSFLAVAVPVGVCMAAAALAVTYLQDARSVPPQLMVVYTDAPTDGTATRLGHAVANSLAVVLVLVPATLFIVGLYVKRPPP